MEVNFKNLVDWGDSGSRKVSKYEVYRYYFSIARLMFNLNLSDREIEYISCVFGNSLNINERGSTKVISEELGVSKQHVANIKSRLIEKGYLDVFGEFKPWFRSVRDNLKGNSFIYKVNLEL
jgi:hypothetical protein